MSGATVTALSAFFGGGAGGLLGIFAAGWVADRKRRKENRAKHMKKWRAGLKDWENAMRSADDPESATYTNWPEIMQTSWYGSLRRHLRPQVLAEIEDPRKHGMPGAGERRSRWALLIEAELGRIEHKWRLK